MAEQPDDKPQEKFEFDTFGEVQGYISLEEAEVQAIEYTRDNPEFLPSRYHTADLVWEINSSTETEDNYDIRLSFRPADAPSEKAGLAQLIFDKTGRLRVPQMLRQPRGGRSGRVLAMAGVGSAAAAVAIVVVLFATGVLPPGSGPVSSPVVVLVTPEEDSRLISPQGRIQVELTPGAVDSPVQLSYRPVILEQASDRPDGLIPASPVFDLSVDSESTSPDGMFTFNEPITLSVKIPSGAEELAGGVASNISIQHFSSIESGWVPMPTSIDFRSSTASAQVKSLSMFALTVREPPPGARAVRTDDRRPVKGYAGQGSAKLSSPQQLAQGDEAMVSLEVGLEEPLTVSEIRFVSLDASENAGGQSEIIPNSVSELDMRVERHAGVPVYSRMKAELAGDSFRITQLEQPEASLKDGTAKWSWNVSPKQGITGIHQIQISMSANARTYRTLEGAIFVISEDEPTEIPVPTDTPRPTPTEPLATTIPTKPVVTPVPKPVPVPTALPIPVATPTPVPFDTPAPVQEWQLENVLVAGDKVTVLVKILGPGWFNITLDGNPTEETIVDGALRADVFRNVPPGSHTVRVFTVGVPGQEEIRDADVMPPTPTFTPTPTPSGPPTPTPLPRYRLFVNGIQVPALNSLIQSDAGTITLSQAPKSDGAYQGGTQVVLVAGTPAGFVVAWGGVEGVRGSFATVEMVADRYITVRMVPRSLTPEPTRSPAPGITPSPSPVPVPTATPVPVGPTPTLLPPTPTHTPQPPGEPTHTPTPTAPPTPTPTPTPVPTFTLTTSASPSGGFEFTTWSGDCSGSGSCLVTMDADKTVIAGFQLIPTPTPTPEPVSAGIAFTSARDGSNDVYVMVDDGSNQTSITNDSGSENAPVWSPDGTKFAFYTDRDGNNEIYVMNVNGSNQVNLTNNSSADLMPSWSPDGNQIAFASDRDGDREIYVINADGTGLLRLSNDADFDMQPNWSPDGNKIAFWRGDGGASEIYVMNSDGSNQIRLTSNNSVDIQPAWSPDGSKIAFVSNRAGAYEIYTMASDGSNQTRVVNNGNADEEPAWSSDGTKIVFDSHRDSGLREIYVVDVDGSNLIRLTNNSAQDRFPDWRR